MRKFRLFIIALLLVGVAGWIHKEWGGSLWHKQPEFLPEAGRVNIIQAGPPPAGAGNWSGPVSYSAAVSTAAPAVVNIYTTQTVRTRNPLMDDPFFRRFFGADGQPQERQASSLGSGVIVSPDGYILTNNHVVASADQIVVALRDGRETKASIIGTDPDTDLAVIRIDLPKLPVVTMRTETPNQVGDVVLAIGNPFGVGQTVTQGIISALGRSGLGINTYEDFIQTDAAINPGNSGGALIDVYGNLVGINSAIYSRSGGNMGIGFAIPAALAKQVMTQIIEKGKVIRGWLGIEVRNNAGNGDLMAGLPPRQGNGTVTVAGVMRGGPAHTAGIEPGDQLVSINNTRLTGDEQAISLIAGLKPGSEARITVERKGRTIDLVATIGERPKAQQNDTENGLP